MDPNRWQQIKGIFQQALEMDPADRPDFLERVCGGDEALSQEIATLLANHQRAGDFIETPAVWRLPPPEALEDTVGAGELSEDNSFVGRTLGAYRVLRQIGQGGMGAVYLAERGDAQYRQQVAVKILKLGMDSRFLVERFRQERQILANLDHPSIARLLDGGALEDGRPYLVMEFIEGEPITDYCTRRQLSIRQRVELFRRVCDAVQYAHRNLVVHRDLKPSNILVSTQGVPKLLDFGTAKLIEAQDPEVQATVTGLRLLTPGYASPEQLKGEPITTASDVYALGIVLYELLTGQRPFRFPDPLSPEVVRIVCEDKPPRPSTVSQASGSDEVAEPSSNDLRQLAGDLDNIVLMALRKEPGRRYATVEQLSEDLRRYLESLPVIARPDTLSYRTAKFVRRHRTGVAAAVLAVLALSGALVAAAWQAHRATRASQRAEQNLVRAEEVSSFLIDLFEVSSPGESKGQEVTARELLEQGVERIRHELRDQPETRAALMDTMGAVFYRLGLFAQAEELLEEARTLGRSLGDEHSDTSLSILSHLGKVRQAQGDLGGAESLLVEALDRRRQHFGVEHPQVAKSLDDLAEYHYLRAAYQPALALHEQALAMRRTLPQVEAHEVAESLNNLATVLLALGQVPAAEQKLREALDIRRQAFGPDHPEVAVTLSNLGSVLHAKGELEEAEPLIANALEIERRLHRQADHLHVAEILTNLGAVRAGLGQIEAAGNSYQEALQVWRRLPGARHSGEAFTLNNLAIWHLRHGDASQAEGLYRKALDIWNETLGPTHVDTRFGLTDLAWLLYNQEDYDAAILEFRRLLEVLREVSNEEDPELVGALEGLGRALCDGGRPREALPFLREALEFQSGHRADSEGSLENEKVAILTRHLDRCTTLTAEHES